MKSESTRKNNGEKNGLELSHDLKAEYRQELLSSFCARAAGFDDEAGLIDDRGAWLVDERRDTKMGGPSFWGQFTGYVAAVGVVIAHEIILPPLPPEDIAVPTNSVPTTGEFSA